MGVLQVETGGPQAVASQPNRNWEFQDQREVVIEKGTPISTVAPTLALQLVFVYILRLYIG